MADENEVRTMMGVSPEMAAEFMAAREVDILALNCGTGVDVAMATDVVRRYRSVSGLPIMAQPNAGQPVLENFKVVYHETPEQMARDLPGLLRAGASIVGGCCGSTPAHIRRFRQILDGGAR
jgi:5-methyltetrahydrofolate--homocysteine methyltransferase